MLRGYLQSSTKALLLQVRYFISQHAFGQLRLFWIKGTKVPITIDYTKVSISKTAIALRSGELNAFDLCNSYLENIEKLNPSLNAYMDICKDTALAEAQDSAERFNNGKPLSMLDGIPVAVKSCLAVKGLPHTAGIKGFKDNISKGDAHVVKKLREAGAVILGTTNMDEGAIGAISDNSYYGRCYNPLDNSMTPGGSSGGSAVAVASAMAAVAIGTDALGSIRIPASYCGIVGFKPSRNLIDTLGLLPMSWTLDTVGTMARSVDDSFLTLAAILGIPMDPSKLPEDITGTTIGIPWQIIEQSQDLDIEVRTAFDSAIETFKFLGATIKPINFPSYDMKELRRAAWLVCEAEAAEFHLDTLRDNPEYFSDNFLRMMHHGQQASDPLKVKALSIIAAVGDIYSEALLSVDAIITPSTPTTAFAFDTIRPNSQADFTTAPNLVGAPSVAVPYGKSDVSGLPFSLQITTDGLSERKAVTIARAFERAVK